MSGRIGSSTYSKWPTLLEILLVTSFVSSVGIYGVHRLLNNFEQNQATKHYQNLPQEEVIKLSDTNNNGNLESDELEKLLKDYKLEKR